MPADDQDMLSTQKADFNLEISIPNLPMSLKDCLALRPGAQLEISTEADLDVVIKLDGMQIVAGVLRINGNGFSIEVNKFYL